jgi:hypothetical protein
MWVSSSVITECSAHILSSRSSRRCSRGGVVSIPGSRRIRTGSHLRARPGRRLPLCSRSSSPCGSSSTAPRMSACCCSSGSRISAVVGRIRALHGARSRRGCRPSDARTDRIHARGIRCDASRATGNPPHPAARRVAPRRDAVDDAGSGGCWVLACAGCARAGGLRMPWRLSRSLAAGRRVVDHVHAGPIVS